MAWRSLIRGGLVTLIVAAAAGCSLSFPITGLKDDVAPTGAIDRTATVLPRALDGEDLRRANAALAVALDPQGNGARVGWQNPQTGAHGGFTAAAPPFADHDRVCRAFVGDVYPGAGQDHRLSGSACRDAEGVWALSDAEDGHKA